MLILTTRPSTNVGNFESATFNGNAELDEILANATVSNAIAYAHDVDTDAAPTSNNGSVSDA